MIYTKIVGTERLFRDLETLRKKNPDMLSRAINRALVVTRPSLSKETAKDYNVKQKEVNAISRRRNATRGTLRGSVILSGPHLSLYKFKKGRANKKKGIFRVQVKRAGGNKVVETYHKTFLATMKSGHEGLFHRLHGAYGESRTNARGRNGRNEHTEKIMESLAPSIPQMSKNEEVIDDVLETAEQALENRMNEEAGKVLGGGE